MKKILLQIKNISKKYNENYEIKNFDLEIEKGEFVYSVTKERFINDMELESMNGTSRSSHIHRSNDQGFHIILPGKDSMVTSTTPF